MAALLAPFRRLRWKLTLNYTAVTVGTILFVEIALAAAALGLIGYLINSDFVPRLAIQQIEANYAPQVRGFLEADPPDVDGLQAWLAAREAPPLPGPTGELATANRVDAHILVFGADGALLGQWPEAGLPAGLVPPLDGPLRAALAGATEPDRLHAADGSWLGVAVPVFDSAGSRVVGVLAEVSAFPASPWQVLRPLLGLVAGSLLLFTVIAGGVGTVFGFLNARRLERRLTALAEATAAWSRGDFGVVVADPAGDELAQLARQLNGMAEQLQNLLAARQELAAVEERNRIARDLHDSVKQQAFAAAAQIGAARALLAADPQAAADRLDEAGRVLDGLRHELGSLIRELHPPALAGRGLPAALRELAASWARQTGIEAAVSVSGEAPLPAEIEQALYRVAQEALSNAARHSGAAHVSIRLRADPDAVALTVVDDGRGFDPAAGTPGFGLRSMRERAAALGGTLRVHSQPGAGTRLTFECPLP